ncbi:helix-turn-helix domain-containing protein [Patescibacteria group bacterium]|nr:helix-turn-helix domain-containing protein [Patescibacteria group bacterium]MBU4512186.1 helix-turn-helix domain-containing protein [Patescibacteria group bacterium]MCG2693464.1 helix-turn-helix domain-containing protein [Candidatus Parcubacteria bacterium]
MSTFIKRRIIAQETLGEHLRKIREGTGLSLREVEKAICLKREYLESLESGNYLDLPGEIYVKNFLKTYGSFLGLDEGEVVMLYEQEQGIVNHALMNRLLLGSRDLFGNKIKQEQAPTMRQGLRLWGITLSSIIKRIIILVLILATLGYLGFEIRKILMPPDLTVLAPVDNLITKETSITFIGSTVSNATVMINDQEVLHNVDGGFEETIDLKLGLNEIKISAFKKHSRPNVVYRRIMVVE